MPDSLIHVLLVEDNPADALLLRNALESDPLSSFEVTGVERLADGLEQLKGAKFDLVLLDLGLPDSAGLETLEQLRKQSPDLPMVVFSGNTDESEAIQAVRAGAQDYLVKSVSGFEMAGRAIRYAIERKRMLERLEFLATHDSLTSLPNRALFLAELEKAIRRARRRRSGMDGKWEMAVVMLDLDNFKSVNDTFGHAEGDVVLKEVAHRLRRTIRESDLAARISGDEFMLIFESLHNTDNAELLAEKLLSAFAPPFALKNRTFDFPITVSIGISLYNRDGEDAESLLKHADFAMYKAKQLKNAYCFFDGDK